MDIKVKLSGHFGRVCINSFVKRNYFVRMKTAFIYTDAYLDYDYGPTHPLQVIRLKLTYDLIKAYGLLDLSSVQSVSTVKAEEKDLSAFHSGEYLNILRQADKGHLSGNACCYGLGPGDNPIFRGLYSWSLLTTGATLQAVDFVADHIGTVAKKVGKFIGNTVSFGAGMAKGAFEGVVKDKVE